MTERNDNLNRELRWLDPVEPGELERAAGSADAAELLERIVSTDHETTPEPRRARRRPPRLAWTAAGAAAIAAAVLILVLGVSARGGGDDLAAALDQAAATAGAQSPAASAQPYTYLKTREMSVDTEDAAVASVKVLESTTREEWVTQDGAGRLKIVDEPSRVIGSGESEEGSSGEARFSSLGFGRRTEDRFLDAGMLRGSVKELPTDPATLAGRLRAKAQVEHGTTPVSAATLELIAEELRDPGASPRLRRALYEAAKRVPGIEYLGEVADPAGRNGIAVGVTSSRSGTPIRYALIFDPGTSQVLATETTAGATLLRARVYLRARGSESMTGNGGSWLSGFDPSATADLYRPNLIYRIPDLGSS